MNGLATVALAILAGGSLPVALRLGLAMTGIQFSIGALNDIVDAPRDRARPRAGSHARSILGPGAKPLADGLVQPWTARAVTVGSAAAGLGLAALSGGWTFVIALAGAACGYAYDLRLSRTAWAWVPLAVALPLVPAFAWTGATGALPTELLALTPTAMLAGGGLAVGNALADLDADRTAGAPSIALRLGRPLAWRLHAAALGVAAALAFAVLPTDTRSGGSPVGVIVLLLGSGILAAGIGILGGASGPGRAAAARLGWQIEAVGVAILGIG
ncbi:MAG TPA: UbiA family prenyltransferase, partial [Candidatus Sulfomarinibacteraceae bacterium]|nr:UbiA family prenyltransferase [Candidatus Sulfomarinibacteraceae bacterium]